MKILFNPIHCKKGFVGFTRRHLHQRVAEHKNSYSSIGKHFLDKHSLAPKDLTENFSVLMKCKNKFDCLVMFFIHELRQTLNVHSASICAKVFNEFFLCMFLLSAFTWKSFYTSYMHIYYSLFQFYHSLDNDRSTVETSFTVDFYRKKKKNTHDTKHKAGMAQC